MEETEISLGELLSKEKLLSCCYDATSIKFLLDKYCQTKGHGTPLEAIILHAIISCPLVEQIQIENGCSCKSFKSKTALLNNFFAECLQRSLVSSFPYLYFPKPHNKTTPEINKRISVKAYQDDPSKDMLIAEYYKGSHYNVNGSHADECWNEINSYLLCEIKEISLATSHTGLFTLKISF